MAAAGSPWVNMVSSESATKSLMARSHTVLMACFSVMSLALASLQDVLCFSVRIYVKFPFGHLVIYFIGSKSPAVCAKQITKTGDP